MSQTPTTTLSFDGPTPIERGWATGRLLNLAMKLQADRSPAIDAAVAAAGLDALKREVIARLKDAPGTKRLRDLQAKIDAARAELAERQKAHEDASQARDAVIDAPWSPDAGGVAVAERIGAAVRQVEEAQSQATDLERGLQVLDEQFQAASDAFRREAEQQLVLARGELTLRLEKSAETAKSEIIAGLSAPMSRWLVAALAMETIHTGATRSIVRELLSGSGTAAG